MKGLWDYMVEFTADFFGASPERSAQLVAKLQKYLPPAVAEKVEPAAPVAEEVKPSAPQVVKPVAAVKPPVAKPAKATPAATAEAPKVGTPKPTEERWAEWNARLEEEKKPAAERDRTVMEKGARSGKALVAQGALTQEELNVHVPPRKRGNTEETPAAPPAAVESAAEEVVTPPAPPVKAEKAAAVTFDIGDVVVITDPDPDPEGKHIDYQLLVKSLPEGESAVVGQPMGDANGKLHPANADPKQLYQITLLQNNSNVKKVVKTPGKK